MFCSKMQLDEASVCRFCLQTCNSDFEVVGESIQEVLNFLLLNLDLCVSDEPVVCDNCIKNLKKCFTFKENCLQENDEKYNISRMCTSETTNVADAFSNCDICYFCTNLTNRNSLEYLKSEDMVEILQKYLPELAANITETSRVCMPCYKSLQNHISFMNDCLNIEEKIRDYCRIEGTNSKGQVELSNVVRFTSKCTVRVQNSQFDLIRDELKEESCKQIKNEEIEVKVKCENFIEIKEHDVDISKEDTNIKTEQNHRNRCQATLEEPNAGREKVIEKREYECKMCPYQSNNKDDFQKHLLTHKSCSNVTMYQCETCTYRSKYKHHVSKHILTHKSSSEITIYKCELCLFQTKHKYYLQKHMLIHKSPSEVTMYRCEICIYQSNQKANLKVHMLTHKSMSEVRAHKCNICNFKSKLKSGLNEHMLTHRSTSEISMCKCNMCPFESKYRKSLQTHLLTHKSSSEVPMFECSICKFKTKLKCNLTRHVLTHKSASELVMFKCELCAYQAKSKGDVSRHMLSHKSASEVTMYKCELCMFQTKRKRNLPKHIRTHKKV